MNFKQSKLFSLVSYFPYFFCSNYRLKLEISVHYLVPSGSNVMGALRFSNQTKLWILESFLTYHNSRTEFNKFFKLHILLVLHIWITKNKILIAKSNFSKKITFQGESSVFGLQWQLNSV